MTYARVLSRGKRTLPNEWGAVHGAFNFTAIDDNYLAVGGPEDPLYVGDEQHVQEFDAKGEWKGEIPLT